AFIAYFLEENLREKIEKIQKELKSLNAFQAKYVERENLHLSFTFLGEIESVEPIIKKLESFRNYGKIEAKLKNLLLIPSKEYFRVIAIGVESEKAEKLRKEIVEKIGGDSKPLHLTLCRVKSVNNKQKVFDFQQKFNFEESIIIDRICLVKSTLTFSGPIYEIIHEISL
ncbi:MAG: RNA 2',3'-cyclic phosphodiesterase, partial [Candidatus Aenigmatarchaeota archaeon]